MPFLDRTGPENVIIQGVTTLMFLFPNGFHCSLSKNFNEPHQLGNHINSWS